MQQWEYFLLDVKNGYHVDSYGRRFWKDELTKLGLEGWELVSVVTEEGFLHGLVLKRPKQEEAEDR